MFTAEKLSIAKNIDKHHVLPRSQFKQDGHKNSDTIANIAFISDETNKSIGNEMPSVYLSKLDKESLDSQCIPTNKDDWCIENAARFWDARRKLLAESFNDYIKKMLPGRRLSQNGD